MATTNKAGPKRILIVDDKASDTLLVKLYLEQTGDYLVGEENDALAALATAEKFRPDLILLDVLMPGMNGGDLAGSLRANPRLKHVPIVFLTALVTKADIKSGVGQLGRYPLLAKPLFLPDLLACLRHQLRGGQVASEASRPCADGLTPGN
ncbi:MAG: response regulator [Lacunisphaera sp.]|nr:response regulator [Lacunisphaera sp.]